jgi:hypothetical protein
VMYQSAIATVMLCNKMIYNKKQCLQSCLCVCRPTKWCWGQLQWDDLTAGCKFWIQVWSLGIHSRSWLEGVAGIWNIFFSWWATRTQESKTSLESTSQTSHLVMFPDISWSKANPKSMKYKAQMYIISTTVWIGLVCNPKCSCAEI